MYDPNKLGSPTDPSDQFADAADARRIVEFAQLVTLEQTHDCRRRREEIAVGGLCTAIAGISEDANGYFGEIKLTDKSYGKFGAKLRYMFSKDFTMGWGINKVLSVRPDAQDLGMFDMADQDEYMDADAKLRADSEFELGDNMLNILFGHSKHPDHLVTAANLEELEALFLSPEEAEEDYERTQRLWGMPRADDQSGPVTEEQFDKFLETFMVMPNTDTTRLAETVGSSVPLDADRFARISVDYETTFTGDHSDKQVNRVMLRICQRIRQGIDAKVNPNGLEENRLVLVVRSDGGVTHSLKPEQNDDDHVDSATLFYSLNLARLLQSNRATKQEVNDTIDNFANIFEVNLG